MAGIKFYKGCEEIVLETIKRNGGIATLSQLHQAAQLHMGLYLDRINFTSFLHRIARQKVIKKVSRGLWEKGEGNIDGK